MIWIVVILGIVAGVAFIRLAPSDAARWHKPIGAAETADGTGWSARVVPATPGLLSDLHQAMVKLPRTELLAGGVSEGRLTYITRSKIIGFPDYTTIEQDGDQIKLYARLRFGKSDMGVNGKRLDAVLEDVRGNRING
jgi:hypothetical protein